MDGVKFNLSLGAEDAQDLIRGLETAVSQERFLGEKHPRIAEHAMVRVKKYERLLQLIRESSVSVERIRIEKGYGEELSDEHESAEA